MEEEGEEGFPPGCSFFVLAFPFMSASPMLECSLIK